MNIRKILTRFTAATLLLVAAGAQAQQAFVARDTAIFAGPDDDYPLVADIDNGYPLYVYGCTGGYTWCDVGFDGYRGWIDGRDIEFPYDGQRLAAYYYGPRFGLPIVAFSIGTYWNRWYYDRPFYSERPRWDRHPPPAAFWNGPPRSWDYRDHDGEHDHGYVRDENWGHGPDRDDHHDQGRNQDNDRDRNHDDDRGPPRSHGQPVQDHHNFDHGNGPGNPQHRPDQPPRPHQDQPQRPQGGQQREPHDPPHQQPSQQQQHEQPHQSPPHGDQPLARDGGQHGDHGHGQQHP